MSQYFSSGEGRCPSLTKVTEPMYYTRTSLVALYERTNSQALHDILITNAGSSFNIIFTLSCQNNGSNGHYWSIKNARVA